MNSCAEKVDRPARLLSHVAALAIALGALAGCSGAQGVGARTEVADKWFKRAEQDFAVARVEDARDAIQKALQIAPNDPEVRTLGARVALARLEYDESIRLLKGLEGSEVQGLRGRALWYRGDLAPAADELEAMLNNPDVRDDWAKAIAVLARRGAGRTPFAISGGLLAPVEMAHVSPVAPYLVVPVEIDGEDALAMISTATGEVVVDSSGGAEANWISLRFGKRVEVSDVPALAQDLSGISKEVGAPIKALIGVNLLRHLNVTMDYGGHQFVVRTFAAPPPPNATRVSLYYARGGGMIVPTSLGASESSRGSLFVDSGMRFPLALDERGWEKAGISSSDLTLVPSDPEQKLRQGVVPMLRLGAFDIRRVPGVLGAPIADVEKGLKLDIDGIIGTPVLANYRITIADGGRMMWIEDTFIDFNQVPGPPPVPGDPQSAPSLPPGAPTNEALPPPAPAPTVQPRK